MVFLLSIQLKLLNSIKAFDVLGKENSVKTISQQAIFDRKIGHLFLENRIGKWANSKSKNEHKLKNMKSPLTKSLRKQTPMINKAIPYVTAKK
jgi:hypothetical protein